MFKLKQFYYLFFSFLICLLVSAPLCFAQETLTITTYYPSPYGSYNRLYVATSLGVGTTSPGSLLDIYSTSQSATNNPGNAALRITAASGANPQFLNVGYDPTLNSGYIQPVRGGTGGTFTNLLLNPNGGNVGIGTTGPTGAKLVIQNAADGAPGVRIITTGTIPTASSTYQGAIFVAQGGAGVTDKIYICMKTSAGVYQWVLVARGD